MNRKIVILLSTALLLTLALPQQSSAKSKRRSKSVIVIDGASYYVHSIDKGDTLYSLSKLYGVGVGDILSSNPSLNKGMRAGDKINILHKSAKKRSAQPNKPQFVEHIVSQGETIFSISREYELSVDTIIDDNPELDPAILSIGQKLNIRKGKPVVNTEIKSDSVTVSYRNSVGNTTPDGLRYYSVAEGDTLHTIAMSYEMSVEQLERVNHITDGATPSAGTLILVRDAMSKAATPAYTQQHNNLIRKKIEHINFATLSSRDTLHVALMLPLSVNSRTMKPFVEFYQGVLMGVNELKQSGRNIVLNLYNTERNSDRVRSIIATSSYQKCNLVIGPVYEDQLGSVLYDAEQRSIPVVSPLASLERSDSPVLFQMAPDAKRRYDKMDDLLGEDRSVTLIEGETNDKSFREEIMGVLASRNIGYILHEYKYEHPSAIEERERAAKRVITAARERANRAGITLDQSVIDSLKAKPSKSDLTSLLTGDEAKRAKLNRDGVIRFNFESDSLQQVEPIADEVESDSEDKSIYHTLFILSNDEVEVDRILSALSSAYAAQIATNRGSSRNIREMIKYKVVANPEWRRYKNIDKAIYYRNNVVLFSSYLAGRDTERIREFDSNYAKAFAEMPSLYAYRGYDILTIFGDAMVGDLTDNLNNKTYKPLESEYRFERDEEHSTIINTNWMRESYNPNFTKSIE